MSAIDELFKSLRARKQKAFMPFVTAGDPDLDFTAAVIRALVEHGAHLCEIGVPYSDPIADGPVIQASYTRALAKGVKLNQILEMTGKVASDIAAPLVTMVSYAIVLRHGLEKYVEEAKASGVAGAIVPDLLVEEAKCLSDICKKHDFSLIQLITPTTPRDRAKRILELSTGFAYYVSVTGITGERDAIPQEVIDSVGWLREQSKLPICIGFGVSKPEHVKALAPVADGLIVGSAIVRRMADAAERPRQQVLEELGAYVAELVAELNPAPASPVKQVAAK